MKKILALLLASLLVISLFAGCAKQTKDTPKKDEQSAANSETTKENMGEKTDEMPTDAEKPTITFVHGYYHDESEWPAAAQMRQIYQDFADMHKDEFTFVAIPDESGAEGIYNTALNDISGGKFYDIADFGGWNIVPVASAAGLILDLKPYLDGDAGFKAGAGVCYDQNLTVDGKIYSVREQIEAVGFWYNEALFAQAGAKVPADWSTWADFEEAVDKLVDAGITPFGLNAGWPTNILTAGRFQADEATRAFYAQGAEVASFDDPAFREVMTFMQEKVLQKIDSANFGPGGDDDEQYRNDFFGGNTAMLFNGVWDAGGSVDCAAGAENIKPANFPTNESGKRASLMSGGTGFVVSNSLTDAQTAACIEFIKYMTSEEIANKIIAFGIGMAPNTNVDYTTLMDSVDAPEAKLLVSACQLCMAADYQALGLGNEFGDFEGEIQSKYAGLKDGSKTVDDVVSELDAVIAAN